MKTCKNFSKRIDKVIETLYKIQEDIEEALEDYDYKEMPDGTMEERELTEKQEENRDELQEEYDEIQNAIDYLDAFGSDNY